MEVAGLLTQGQDQHEQLTKKQGRGPDELSEPNLEQWAEKDGKFARDKKDPTATLGPANSSTRTTSPKDAKAVAAMTTTTVEKKEKKVVEKEKTFEKEKKIVGEKKVVDESSEKGPDAKTTLDITQKRKLTELLKANNCLINAIANEAGVKVTYEQLVTIRLRLGSIGEMLIANGKTIAIIMDVLGITRGRGRLLPRPHEIIVQDRENPIRGVRPPEQPGGYRSHGEQPFCAFLRGSNRPEHRSELCILSRGEVQEGKTCATWY